MHGLFQRGPRHSGFLATELGTEIVARALPAGLAVPGHCCGLVVDADGRTRRMAAGHRASLAAGETAWCFHPGPYTGQMVPFAAAPEIGLAVHFVVDRPDPRLEQQRFDLFLASECGGSLMLVELVRGMEQALQRELAQGNMELPPCTTVDEWNAFRAGFDQLLYTRFGIVVEDCVPVDLGGMCDYGRMLLDRLECAVPPMPVAASVAVHQVDARAVDARALRRLFLELPCLMRAVRLAALPASGVQFRTLQALLQRLDLLGLSVATMPALGLQAPGQALLATVQARRAHHCVLAAESLDEAWALLARFERAEAREAPALLDELDRIAANLEFHCAARRSIHPEDEQ
ncbi:hypothetical protein GCM10027321_14850 [Massilia terrae]|uniref:Uncharacterized protein n=1 Tax=Massilia terrae TaxID=1811224 RepID=A0ABT2CUL7_9BURK|nr:hypothetical protein [Massilia terrae]MCS0657671.1 hypothetical protein [Massilia terrae]